VWFVTGVSNGVPIRIGHDYGDTVEVSAGLTRTDQVVLNPSDSLVSGTRVEIDSSVATVQLNEKMRPSSGCFINASTPERLHGGS
jgi:hypothetical protein